MNYTPAIFHQFRPLLKTSLNSVIKQAIPKMGTNRVAVHLPPLLDDELYLTVDQDVYKNIFRGDETIYIPPMDPSFVKSFLALQDARRRMLAPSYYPSYMRLTFDRVSYRILWYLSLYTLMYSLYGLYRIVWQN